MRYFITIFLCGVLFGCGLTISNMINPNKVLGFLDVAGNWDPSLALVMLSAVIITWIGYRFVLKKKCPLLAEKFYLPEKKSIDTQLVIGSIIFGIGWGLAGYCPGPALSALGLVIMDALYFILGMITSLFIYRALQVVF